MCALQRRKTSSNAHRPQKPSNRLNKDEFLKFKYQNSEAKLENRHTKEKLTSKISHMQIDAHHRIFPEMDVKNERLPYARSITIKKRQ